MRCQTKHHLPHSNLHCAGHKGIYKQEPYLLPVMHCSLCCPLPCLIFVTGGNALHLCSAGGNALHLCCARGNALCTLCALIQAPSWNQVSKDLYSCQLPCTAGSLTFPSLIMIPHPIPLSVQPPLTISRESLSLGNINVTCKQSSPLTVLIIVVPLC